MPAIPRPPRYETREWDGEKFEPVPVSRADERVLAAYRDQPVPPAAADPDLFRRVGAELGMSPAASPGRVPLRDVRELAEHLGLK